MTDPIQAVLTLDAFQASEALINFVSSVRDAVDEIVELAETQASAERSFLEIAKLRGQNTSALLEEQQEFNAALQEFTGIGDEVLLGLQKQALAMNVQRDELSKVTLAAVGMAEAHDLSLNEAIRKASRVINGEVEQLQELGQNFETSAAAIDFYANASELATERAERLTGAQASLDATLGDIGETLGSVVNESDELIESTTELDRVLRNLNQGLIDNKPALQDFFDNMVRLTKDWGAEAALVAGAFAPFAAVGGTVGAGLLGLGELADQGEAAGDFVGPPQETDRERARRIIREEREREVEARKSKQRLEREKRDRERAERERERAEDREKRSRMRSEEIAARDAERTRQAEIEAIQKHNERLLDEQRRLDAERLALQAAADRERRETFEMAEAAFSTAIHQGFSASIGAVVEAAVQGETDVSAAVGGLVGGIISTQGDMLIQLGTAGILAGTLGTVIPAFAALTGGPLGVAAGSAAVAGGIAMKAVGAALGGASSGGGSSSASAPGSAGSLRGGSAGRGGRAQDELAFLERARAARRGDIDGSTSRGVGGGFGAGETNTTNVFQVSLRGAVVARSEQQLALDLEKLTRLRLKLKGKAAEAFA